MKDKAHDPKINFTSFDMLFKVILRSEWLTLRKIHPGILKDHHEEMHKFVVTEKNVSQNAEQIEGDLVSIPNTCRYSYVRNLHSICCCGRKHSFSQLC